MNLVDVDAVQRIETEQPAVGGVFIGTRTWQQVVHGETFPLHVVIAARSIAQENPDDAYTAVRAWAEKRGYNAYHANLLAGHFWSLV